MATFGTYETVREIHRSGLASLWSARRAGAGEGGEPAFAVKACEPDPDIAGPEAARQSIAAFLNQVKVQKEAAAAGSHWAPIHESGEHASGAFLVTDLFPRTAERLTLSRVRQDPGSLRAIVSGVVAGLRELEKSSARPHGNLKAANVLIGPGDLVSARVALCDPLPSRAARGLKPGADARALGELIYLLVTHQPPRGAYPIEASPEWAPLGRTRDGWLALCNRLLDPHPQGGAATLEEIEKALAGLVPPKRLVPLPAVVVGAAVLVLGCVGAVIFLSRTSGPTQSDLDEWARVGKANWEAVCQAYIDKFHEFRDALGEAPESGAGAGRFTTRADLYVDSDPRLAEALQLLAAAKKNEKDAPGLIVGRPRTELGTLKGSEPKEAQTKAGMDHTARLLGAVTGIDGAVRSGGWPPAARLTAAAAALEGRGWGGIARKVREQAPEASSGGWGERATKMDRVLAADSLARSALERVERLDARAAELDREKDPVLKVFRSLVAGAGSSLPDKDGLGSLSDLDGVLAYAEGLGTRLGDAVKSDWLRVDREFFTSKSPVYTAPESRPAKEVLESWLLEVAKRDYAQLDPADDPVFKWTVAQRLTDIGDHLDALRREQQEEPEEVLGAKLLEFERRAGRVTTDADAVKAIIWNLSNKSQKLADADRVSVSADGLLNGLSQFKAERDRQRVTGAQDARDKLGADPGPAADSAAISAAWNGWRDALVAQIDQNNFRPLARRAGEARDLLTRVNAAFPAAAKPTGAAQAWNRQLAELAMSEREARLASLLANHRQPPEAGGAAEIESAAARAGEEFARWSASLSELKTGLTVLEQLLDAGYGLHESPGYGHPTVAQRAGEIGGSPLLSRPEVAEACRTLTGRVEALTRITGANTIDPLAGVLSPGGSTDPEAVIAAWRRLDAVPGWPAPGADLHREAAFRERVAADIGRIGDDSRREALRKELADSGRSRWERALRGARDAPDVADTIGMMASFGVLPETLQDPSLRYNVLVDDLRRFVTVSGPGGGRSDDEVRSRATAFLAAMRAMPPEVLGQSKVGSLADALALIAEGAEAAMPKVDVATLGPGRVPGWTGAPIGEGEERFLYSGPGGAQIEFVRIAAPDGLGTSVFVGATEVPVGLMFQVSGVDGLLPPPQERRGPSAWTRGGGGLGLSATWLDAMATTNLNRINEQALADVVRPVVDTGKPALTHPVQQVSASAALYIARSLGCRLLTAAEWRAARDAFPTPAQRPNLRDQAWLDRQAKVRALDDRLVGDVRKDAWLPWPDRGVVPPKGTPPPVGRDAAAGPEDDGEAWFVPVAGSGGGPYHLVGNVAEYVFESAAESESLADGSPDSIRAFVESNAGKVGVVGGSALSAPGVPIDEPLPVDVFDLEALIGYADVGLRLAFSADVAPKRKSFAARVTEALTDNPYVASP